MFCKKCGNEIKEGEKFCSKCGTNTDKKSKKNVLIISSIIGIVCVVAIIVGVYFITQNKTVDTSTSASEENKNDKEGMKTDSANAQMNGNATISFASMNADDKNLNEQQQEVLKYFDDNYFLVYPVGMLQQYPQVFNNAKIQIGMRIVKVLKSTNDEFEVLAVIGEAGIEEDYIDRIGGLNNIPESDLFVVKGKQLNERFLVNDTATIYGRYNGVENYEVDGKTYILPVVSSIHTIKDPKDSVGHRYDLSTIKTVAKHIFGNDIKVTEPSQNDCEDNINLYVSSFGAGAREVYTYQDFYYTVTLDNQSNANFKAFDIHVDTSGITYSPKYNEISGNVMKNLYVSADFQHYIVTTYDQNTKHIYIDYFDKDLKKLWGQEFDYESNLIENSPMDYNSKNIAIVIDNELHILDLQNGEDTIEPVNVGEKIKVHMMTDGVILIGNDNKNTVMKIGFDGKTIFKLNGNTGMEGIKFANTQIIDGKLMVELKGNNRKYLIINNDGNMEFCTEDLNLY